MKRIYVLCFIVLLAGVMIGGVSASHITVQNCLDIVNISEFNGCYNLKTRNSTDGRGGIISMDDFRLCFNIPSEQPSTISGWKPYSINSYTSSFRITINGKDYYYPHNLLSQTKYSGSDIEELLRDSRTDFHRTIIRDNFFDDSIYTGEIIISLKDGLGDICFYGAVIEDDDLDQRISSLESWKTSITTTINNILTSITSLVTTTDDHEERIETLENSGTGSSSSSSGSGSDSEFKSYLKYLGDSDKKKILCGYAQEKHLTNIQDLGLNCDLFYKTLSSGKEKVSCKC